ncbi:MAG TPA: amidohydrolase family protein [Candidatus Limnocylindrales bacterium]|nr:amidohydrolase family protein [Candidatus Limnocylindrales bacterium]
MTTERLRRTAAMVGLSAFIACSPNATAPSPPTRGSAPDPTGAASPLVLDGANLVIVGRIITLDDPPIAEAVFIEDGLVASVGTRDEVLAAAGDGVPILDIGDNVAYPGFIDVHSHWIGDRGYYGIDTAETAIDAAVRRGWTSISEQWVNQERIDELTRLAADGALPLRVDAYLALNYDREFFGDWYTEREPGPVDDRLRVRGLKIHLDDGWGKVINWVPGDLTAAVRRADAAGWQVSVHAMSTAAQELALDAFEAAIGPTGPNRLHHRVEHASQVSDDQLARLVAMDIGVVVHLDGAADWILDPRVIAEFDRDDPGADADPLARWRDFVDAGLHVASATDAPWTFPDLKLTDALGRPGDHIAAGMDGRVRSRPETPSWLRDQLLTADQALRTVTLDAAWILDDDARRGHLAPGTLGDVTILSRDVTTASPAEIRAMTVAATIVGGIAAFCGDPRVCATR